MSEEWLEFIQTDMTHLNIVNYNAPFANKIPSLLKVEEIYIENMGGSMFSLLNFSKLQKLSLSNVRVSDICLSPSITSIYLENLGFLMPLLLRDITNLVNLGELNIINERYAMDITNISSLTKLEYLSLKKLSVANPGELNVNEELKCIGSLILLKCLRIEGITTPEGTLNITFITNLTNLEKLCLVDLKVQLLTDGCFAGDLITLQKLTMKNIISDQKVDLSGITNLTNLNYLCLEKVNLRGQPSYEFIKGLPYSDVNVIYLQCIEKRQGCSQYMLKHICFKTGETIINER